MTNKSININGEQINIIIEDEFNENPLTFTYEKNITFHNENTKSFSKLKIIVSLEYTRLIDANFKKNINIDEVIETFLNNKQEELFNNREYEINLTT